MYRNCLKLAPRAQLEAYTLNNLACTAWYHYREAMKVKTIPEQTREKEMVSKDSEHIINYFKETIEKLEKIHNDKHEVKRSVSQLQMLENLFTKDPSQVIPKDFHTETEEEYFDLLKSPDIGKALSNLSEFLLETEGMQGKSKAI